MSTKQEYIAEADRFLVQAGVLTYGELIVQRNHLAAVLAMLMADYDVQEVISRAQYAQVKAALTIVAAA